MFLYNSICNYLLELLPFLKKKTKTKDINKGVHLKKKEAPKNLIDTGVYQINTGGEARIDKIKKKIQCFITQKNDTDLTDSDLGESCLWKLNQKNLRDKYVYFNNVLNVVLVFAYPVFYSQNCICGYSFIFTTGNKHGAHRCKKKNLTFEAGQMPKFTAGHIFECWALIG